MEVYVGHGFQSKIDESSAACLYSVESSEHEESPKKRQRVQKSLVKAEVQEEEQEAIVQPDDAALEVHEDHKDLITVTLSLAGLNMCGVDTAH